jgi:SAM-dependent methyltransferase
MAEARGNQHHGSHPDQTHSHRDHSHASAPTPTESHGDQNDDGHHGHGHHDHSGHDQDGRRTHRFSAAHIERLLSAERAQSMPPVETLRMAGIGPGMTVVDLGCGPGFFTIPAHEIVGPNGHVIAADVQPEMLEHLRGRLADAEIHDVQILETGDGHVPMADHSADVVLAAFVLHEADDPGAFLGECARLLKPHGWVAVIEWRHEADLGIPVAHRISVPTITDLAARVGLTKHEVTNLDDDRVLLHLAHD